VSIRVGTYTGLPLARLLLEWCPLVPTLWPIDHPDLPILPLKTRHLDTVR